MLPARSLLFVPGSREEWVADADTHGADVVILDLEDSVPPGETERARETVAENLPRLAEAGQRVFVRINGHPNDPDQFTAADIEAVACEHVEAIFVPKFERARDAERLDTVLEHVERRDGLAPGSIDVVVAIETALGMRNAYDICSAVDRVRSISNGAVEGTDTNHALGFEWTGPGREGLETVHMRQKALLDARAAGIEDPFAGPYAAVDDTEGLREDMLFARQMGYTGYVVIHPSHVDHANEIFTPDEETVEYWLGAREALVRAREEGRHAVRYEGDMIDTATLGTANRYLRRARAFESDVDVDLSGVSIPET